MQDYTIDLISRALDACIMRQTAIANHIANANTHNVNFEEQLQNRPLRKLADESELRGDSEQRTGVYMSVQEDSSTESTKQVASSVEFPKRSNASLGMAAPIFLDEQIALSVKNATHFRALIKGLNHKLAIMRLALQGNT